METNIQKKGKVKPKKINSARLKMGQQMDLDVNLVVECIKLPTPFPADTVKCLSNKQRRCSLSIPCS